MKHIVVPIAIICEELKSCHLKGEKIAGNSIQQILEPNHFQLQVFINYHMYYAGKDTIHLLIQRMENKWKLDSSLNAYIRLKATSQMDWSTFNPIKPDNGI
jgi:hypothetical protein